MKEDLHIHSALSPCADDDMLPTNIVRMALLNGLTRIAVCDHNSVANQIALKQAADKFGLNYGFGVELQTQEEVHVLGYFETIEDILKMDEWLCEVSDPAPNRIDLFGNQWIVDHDDTLIKQHSGSLIRSLNASLNQCVTRIHACHGKVVLAHVLGRSNGIIHQLAFIPKNLAIDGIEVTEIGQKQELIKKFPWLSNVPFFLNSDAHRLIDLRDVDETDWLDDWETLWRKRE